MYRQHLSKICILSVGGRKKKEKGKKKRMLFALVISKSIKWLQDTRILIPVEDLALCHIFVGRKICVFFFIIILVSRLSKNDKLISALNEDHRQRYLHKRNSWKETSGSWKGGNACIALAVELLNDPASGITCSSCFCKTKLVPNAISHTLFQSLEV